MRQAQQKQRPEERKTGVLDIGSLPFSLKHTLISGQAFRWRKEGTSFVGVVSGNVLALEQRGERVVFNSSPGDTGPGELRRYLGLDAAYEEALRSLPDDPVLQLAIRRFQGMRVLRQDPWETLISFIISSNNSIIRIKRCIESLCRSLGQEIQGAPGFYSFPAPDLLATASLKCLKETCNLGYRHVYVKESARRIARDSDLLTRIALLPYRIAKEKLIAEFPGVGPKVADCVLLYSMGKYEAFPIDTWIKKVMENAYFDGQPVRDSAIRLFAADYFGPFAGYAQLYLFQYAISGGADSLPEDAPSG